MGQLEISARFDDNSEIKLVDGPFSIIMKIDDIWSLQSKNSKLELKCQKLEQDIKALGAHNENLRKMNKNLEGYCHALEKELEGVKNENDDLHVINKTLERSSEEMEG